MRRRELLAAGAAGTFLAAAGCLAAPRVEEAEPAETLAATDVTDWPMFLFDPSNRRCFAGDVVPDDEAAWTVSTDGAIWSSPVVADGTAYIGSYDRHLYAVDIDEGTVSWRYRTGDRVDGTPAVADGTVYVGSFDRNLYALDAASGEERWMYGSDGIVRSSPTVVDGTVYLGTHCRVEECTEYYDVRWPAAGSILALDASTGDLRWRHPVGDGVIGSPVVADGLVVVGSSDGSLYALSAATGEPEWTYETGGPIIASPTVDDGRVYAGSLAGGLFAFDLEDGRFAWHYEPPDRSGEGEVTQELITGSPVVCGDTVYAGAIETSTAEGSHGALWAISADTGHREWSAGPFGEMIGSSPTVVDGRVFVGAHTLGPMEDIDPGVFALSADGAVDWRFTVDGETNRGFGSSPAIAEGQLLIGGSDGTLYAFDLEALDGR